MISINLAPLISREVGATVQARSVSRKQLAIEHLLISSKIKRKITLIQLKRYSVSMIFKTILGLKI